MQVERFLAITAMLAASTVMGVGCSSSDTATDTDAGPGNGGAGQGGSGGSAGSATGGTAGTATGGTAGTATGGAAGGGGTAGAAGACFGDTTVSDASTGVDCNLLPYAAEDCGADAGVEGSPTGLALCGYIAGVGRPGVAEGMFNCLAAITGSGCDAAHDTAAQGCYDSTAANTCEPADPVNAPSANCAQLESECPGVAAGDCKLNLDMLTDAAGDAVLDCYQTPVGTCDEDFYFCLGLP